jgi:hypothetical protein
VGNFNLDTTALGGTIRQILDQEDLLPGDEPSYQICKSLFLAHPFGQKMAELPVSLAQTQERDIKVPGPEDVAERFREQWKEDGATRVIRNLKTQSRIYGLATVGLIVDKVAPDKAVDPKSLYKRRIGFNVWDPLNTAGLIVNQDPNSIEFQKHGDVVVMGKNYHRSRTRTVMNEESIYLAFTGSAYAYAGRSVYQRPFYPLKSFLETLLVDHFVARKAGLLITKMEQAGSIIDQTMQDMWSVKRWLLKLARNFGVLSMGITESAETLNMQNIDGAYGMARDNIIKNIATGAPMPAKLLTEESFVLGFGEGTEDSKHIAQYLDGLRIEMDPIYGWFDDLIQHRAWNEEWYTTTLQKQYPDSYAGKTYAEAFYEWTDGFEASWPNILKEEPSELVQVAEVKMKAAIAATQVLAPLLDPYNMGLVIEWLTDQFNVSEDLFASTLDLDMDRLEDFLIDQDEQRQEAAAQGVEDELAKREHVENAPKPFAAADSAEVGKLLSFVAEQAKQQRRARRLGALR